MKKADFSVRVTKKGKTRGRPSKAELLVSQMASRIFDSKEYQEEMHKVIMDEILYGESRYSYEDGKLKHIPLIKDSHAK